MQFVRIVQAQELQKGDVLLNVRTCDELVVECILPTLDKGYDENEIVVSFDNKAPERVKRDTKYLLIDRPQSQGQSLLEPAVKEAASFVKIFRETYSDKCPLTPNETKFLNETALRARQALDDYLAGFSIK